MADPIDTGKKTVTGRTIWHDPETGEDYSERSTTFKIDNKYYTMPTVAEDGSQYTEDQIKDYVKEHGPLDYLTGEKLPEFRYREDAIQYAVSRSDTRKQKEKPMLQEQMELFNEGGLKDEGGMIDEESGNDVPSGSTRKEVRDDIPAMLSEGEFIFPADVVRYIGLDKLMRIRQDAKMGLKEMEAMGQMGNSEEATMPDDLPFGMADLIIVEEPEEKAHGGMVDEYNTGGIVWPTHPTIPVEIVTYHNPETGEKIEVRTQQGVPIDAVPKGFVLFDSTPVTPTTPVTQPTALTQRAVSNDNDSTPPPVNKFVEAGGWNGAPLETYISEAEKVTGLTGSIMSGVVAAIGGPVVGIFAHLAQKANKNKILNTIDARIEEAKKTTVPGQVAALRAMKAKLEGKADNQSILGKIGDVLSSVVDSIGDSLGLTSDQKDKVKKVAIAAEGAPTSSAPTDTIRPTARPTSLGAEDQEVVDAVTSGGAKPLTPEEMRQLESANLQLDLAETAASTVESTVMGSSYTNPSSMKITRELTKIFNPVPLPDAVPEAFVLAEPKELPKTFDPASTAVEPKELDKNSLLSNVNVTTKRDTPDTSPITLPLETSAKIDANVPPPLINPDTLNPRTSIAQNNANELIARSLASEQLNLSDKIKELVGINTLGDAPIAGTSKDPRVTSTVEPTVDSDSDSDNYNYNSAEERRKRILKLTGKDSQDSPPPTTVVSGQSSNNSGGNDNNAHKDMMSQASQATAASKAKAISTAMKKGNVSASTASKLSGSQMQAGSGVGSGAGGTNFAGPMNKGGLMNNKTNSKKRGLAARK
jgi:hypothetical protein